MRALTAPVSEAEAVQELLKRARTHLIRDPHEALAAASDALVYADSVDDRATRALAYDTRGEAHRFAGQVDSALEDYIAAGRLYRELGRAVDAARTEASVVDSLRTLGRLSEALSLAARVRRVFRRHQEPLRMAILDEIVGLIHFQQGDYQGAMHCFDRARPSIAELGAPGDLAVLNNNAATALTNLDRLAEAERLYAAAREYYAIQGSDSAQARLDVNLGYLAFRQGRYGAAVDLLRRAGDVFERIGNLPVALATRLDLVETYLALNLLDETASLSQEQLQLAERLGFQRERARALFYLSTQLGRLGRFDEALAGLRQAERAFAEQRDAVHRERCNLACAALLLTRGQPEDVALALRLGRRAARVFARQGLSSRHASACVLLARAYLQRGRARRAEDEAREAFWLAETVGLPWLLFDAHYILARALRRRGDREAAYVELRAATEALERVRAELEPEELRQSLVSDKTEVYQELVAICLERGATHEALRHAERAKSRALAERLVSAVEVQVDPHLVGRDDANLLGRMRQLRNELVWLYSRLSDGGGSDMPRVRRDVAERERELMRLQRRLQPASRAHALGLGIAGSIADVDARLDPLRRRLEPGTKVLEYFAAGDELVLFVFDGRRLVPHRLGPMRRIAELVDRLRFQISKFRLGESYIRGHADDLLRASQALLAELYAALIDPAADDLLDASRLIILPHGALHYLPFHALVDPAGAALVERIEISYAPSAAVLASCLDRCRTGDVLDRPLLVGVPQPGIPEVRTEIEALRGLFPTPRVFAGEAATEEAFRREAPLASLVHLASHAVFRQDNPMFSSIRLADGWLSLYDLYDLRLRAGLVTLSACETGVNSVLAGDELVGLTRGFFQAGAASVVVSLWAISDKATAQLMEAFYSRLGKGLGVAGSMRAAQAALRERYPHPYYWAPFLVVGRP